MIRKLIVVLSFCLLLILAATWWYQRPYFKSFGSYGFIATYHSIDDPIYDAEYIIVSKINNKLVVEIIAKPGVEGVTVLKDKEAENYLRKLDIDF